VNWSFRGSGRGLMWCSLLVYSRGLTDNPKKMSVRSYNYNPIIDKGSLLECAVTTCSGVSKRLKTGAVCSSVPPVPKAHLPCVPNLSTRTKIE
jgi:hypothetical protein